MTKDQLHKEFYKCVKGKCEFCDLVGKCKEGCDAVKLCGTGNLVCNFHGRKGMNYQESTHKEFSDLIRRMELEAVEFDTDECTHDMDDIQSFYDTKIQEILQELVGEESVGGGTTQNWDLHANGYNKKRQELLDKIKELGYAIQE